MEKSNLRNIIVSNLQDATKIYGSEKEIKWNHLCRYYKLSEVFIRQYKFQVNWTAISRHQTLSNDFMYEFARLLSWNLIFQRGELNFTEQFIRSIIEKTKPSTLSNFWAVISEYQKLSEDFIDDFSDEVDWDWICRYQKLSRDFLIKHFDKIDIDWLWSNSNVSNEIKEEIKLMQIMIF